MGRADGTCLPKVCRNLEVRLRTDQQRHLQSRHRVDGPADGGLPAQGSAGRASIDRGHCPRDGPCQVERGSERLPVDRDTPEGRGHPCRCGPYHPLDGRRRKCSDLALARSAERLAVFYRVRRRRQGRSRWRRPPRHVDDGALQHDARLQQHCKADEPQRLCERDRPTNDHRPPEHRR